MTQKQCTKCLVLKDILEFRNDKRMKSGKGSVCLICTRQDARDRRSVNAEKYRQSNKEWREKNREYDSQRKMLWAKQNQINKKSSDKKYHEKNKEKRAQKSLEYRKKNRERLLQANNAWRKANYPYVLSKNAFRRAEQLKRTPKWLTLEDKKQMDEIYRECRKRSQETGIPHHVDHIYPLLGKDVSGLHVPANLQILTASENVRKKNKTYDLLYYKQYK
jgi:hypothetical protein